MMATGVVANREDFPLVMDAKDLQRIFPSRTMVYRLLCRDDIDIPSSVTQIESDAFDGNARMVILCDAGSAAETFARTRGIPYVLR